MFSLNKPRLLFKNLKYYSPIYYSTIHVKHTPSFYSFPTKRNFLYTCIQNSLPVATIRPNSLALPLTLFFLQRRHRAEFAPRRTKYRKAHKGRVPVRIGGSTKGNTIAFG